MQRPSEIVFNWSSHSLSLSLSFAGVVGGVTRWIRFTFIILSYFVRFYATSIFLGGWTCWNYVCTWYLFCKISIFQKSKLVRYKRTINGVNYIEAQNRSQSESSQNVQTASRCIAAAKPNKKNGINGRNAIQSNHDKSFDPQRAWICTRKNTCTISCCGHSSIYLSESSFFVDCQPENVLNRVAEKKTAATNIASCAEWKSNELNTCISIDIFGFFFFLLSQCSHSMNIGIVRARNRAT